jgi:hypothetical protein
LQWKLKNNQLATIDVKDTTVAEENPTSVAYGDTKSREDPPTHNSSDKVDSSSSVFYLLLSQAHSQGSNQKKNSSRIQSPIYVSEKCYKEGFKVIGYFQSAKKIAKILGTSTNEIIKLKNSGEIYKDRYKFT